MPPKKEAIKIIKSNIRMTDIFFQIPGLMSGKALTILLF